jgi:NADP-dependent 3-hydroxy acid dehydrogenase YdfG
MTAFVDQVAVVTGASSGIGKAIALNLAAQGATLCLVGRKLETLEAVARNAEIDASARYYRTDLALDEDIQTLLRLLQQDLKRIDILVHSAGVISLGHWDVAPIADFDWQYRINVRAPYVLTQGLLPMLKACQGQVVFINSSAGLLNARANLSQYAATKHALRAIADSLRDEVNAAGVRVLSVYPGRTASPMQMAVHKIEGRPYDPERLMQPEDVAAVVINALSLPRSAEVTDINVRPLAKL